MPPAAKPQPMAKGRAAHCWAMSAGCSQHRPHQRPAPRAGHQPRQERALEGDVEAEVAHQQACHHARRQDQAEADGKEELHRPPAALVDEEVAEPMVADHHHREERHRGDADDERDQQKLLLRKGCAGLAHATTIAAGLEACQTPEDERVIMTRRVTARLPGAFSCAPLAARRHDG